MIEIELSSRPNCAEDGTGARRPKLKAGAGIVIPPTRNGATRVSVLRALAFDPPLNDGSIITFSIPISFLGLCRFASTGGTGGGGMVYAPAGEMKGSDFVLKSS